MAEIRDPIRAKAVEVGAGSWITGYGWSEDQLDERRRPTVEDLDAAAPGRGRSGRTFAEEERLTMLEALRAYTVAGAYLTREERLKGTLEVGKLADLAVLSADPLTTEGTAILDIEVEQTYLGGKLAYDSRATP